MAVKDTLLPHSLEAEEAVLGAILADSECMSKVTEQIATPDYFYKKAHQLIFETFRTLAEKGDNIDVITAAQALKDQGHLEEIGGRSYLSALTDHAPIAANAEYYAKIVKSKSLLRNMITIGNDIVELGYKSEEDPSLLVDKAEQLVFGLAQSKSKEDLTHIANLVHRSWEMLEEREANKGALTGVDTGYYDLNAFTSGFQKSDLIILAARPSMGKCLHEDAELVLEDGSITTIKDIYKSKVAKLLTLNNDWKLGITKPSDFIDDGIKPVFEVTTRSGRQIKTTITHPFLTIEGWKKLGEIEVGTRVACPREIPVFGTQEIRDCEAKLLGYLLGGQDSQAKNYQQALEEFANTDFKVEYCKQSYQATANSSIPDIQYQGQEYNLDFNTWLTKLGLNQNRFIPQMIFTAPQRQIALFLSSLFTNKNTQAHDGKITFTHTSEQLIRAVQHLLLRFGILASIKYTNHWELSIGDPKSLNKFISSFDLEHIKLEINNETDSIDSKGDIYWDEIVSIEYTGDEQVYDLTIPETHNFVANDICVHNTALCLNIAENAAIIDKKPVAVFSLEMSKEQLVQRLLCARAEVDSSRVRTGQLYADDWAKLGEAMTELGEAPIYIDDSAGVTVMELRGKCRRLKAQHGDLGLIIIDYLQLIEGRSSNDNRINQMSEISRGLKLLAREINTPVVALSQLSRAVESRPDKRPMLSDLRESGSIEQDADIVLFIYRDEYYNKEESESPGMAEVIIAKQRNGPVGTVELLFQSNITKFKNPA